MTLITLSAPYGAGGSHVGPAVAQRLGLPFLDRAIPTGVAERLAVPLREAIDRDESVGSWLTRALLSFGQVTPVLAGAAPAPEHVLTDDAFVHMIALATRFAAGIRDAIDRHDLPWSVAQIGARVEYRFASPPPRTGSESAAADDRELEDFLHVHLANRGVLITPFHLMALMSPATTEADVDRHTELFGGALDRLT